MAFSSMIRIALIPLFGLHLWEIALFDLILFANVQFHHANIALPRGWDGFFRIFLTSPDMHKVHHSMNPKELNSNYTAFLSIWDRNFGSFKMVDSPEEIDFGVEGYRDPKQQKLSSLVVCPFTLNRDANSKKR